MPSRCCRLSIQTSQTILPVPRRQFQVRGRTPARERKQKKEERGIERLSVYDVTQIIQSRKNESRLELVALAVTQSREGNVALANFVANRGQKAVSEALSLAKEFSEAEERLARSKKSRV